MLFKCFQVPVQVVWKSFIIGKGESAGRRTHSQSAHKVRSKDPHNIKSRVRHVFRTSSRLDMRESLLHHSRDLPGSNLQSPRILDVILCELQNLDLESGRVSQAHVEVRHLLRTLVPRLIDPGVLVVVLDAA